MGHESKRLVVGIDGSDHSLIALRRAIDEAEAHDAELHVVHVAEEVTEAVLHLPGNVNISTTDLADARRADVWKASESTLEAATGSLQRVDLNGYPAQALIEYCSTIEASLLVLGTRSRGKFASALLGSTTLAAIQQAGCDVLVARAHYG